MTTALIATPSPNDTDAQLQAVKPEEAVMSPTLNFPNLYIIAPAPRTKGEQAKAWKAIQRREAIPGQHLAVFNIETAPARAFEAWLVSTCAEHAVTDPKFISEIGSLNWMRWPLKDRWEAINMLAEYLKDRAMLPLYESKEAAQAAMQCKEAEESAGNGNESEAADEQP